MQSKNEIQKLSPNYFVGSHKSKNVFLLLDEVPCNSNKCGFKLAWGKSSGDWREINSDGINLMMALRPIGEGETRAVYTGQ